MKSRDQQGQGTAAGKPAVTLPGIVTEQDREIVARRKAGETRKAICEALGVTVGKIYHAEYACRNDASGRKLLAKRPDSIFGLEEIGELEGNAADRLRFHHYHHECPELEGLSEVAALGRLYVSRIKGIGPKSLASIDRALGLFGMEWSPIDRTPKPKPREATQPGNSQYWADIVRHVCALERSAGTGVLQDDPYRDCMEGIALRLAFLNGYMESALQHRRHMRDITPEPERDDGEYETAGNIVCLPGVTLASIRREDGDDPGPTAA